MSYVDDIVSAFGGVRNLANLLELPTTTVSSWKSRGSIPDKKKPLVLAAAAENGVGITEVDFFPVRLSEPPSAKRGAA